MNTDSRTVSRTELAQLKSDSIAHRRSAFTLVELMATVMIIMMLAGILLPSVQQARERARLQQCQNNLFQISLALQNYANANNSLPSGVVNPTGPIALPGLTKNTATVDPIPPTGESILLSGPIGDANPLMTSNQPSDYHMSWIAQILPFIEMSPLYRQINFHEGAYSKSNSPAGSARIPLLQCPSNTGRSSTCYAGNHNDFETPIDVQQNGLLFLNSSINFNDVDDGCSNTILLTEINSTSNGLSWLSGTSTTLRNFVNWTNRNTPDEQPQFVAHDFNDSSIRYQQTLRSMVDSPSTASSFVGGPGSMHRTLFNISLADGSVRSISYQIDARVLRNLAHRADGEIIGDY